MDTRQAEKVLKQEIASGSNLGKALVALLDGLELENYRQSKSVNDPLVLARVNGWAEGINSVRKRITPDPATAPDGQSVPVKSKESYL